MRFTKILSLALTLAMLLGMVAACTQSNVPETTSATASTTTTITTTQTPEQPPAPPVSDEGLMLWYDFKNGQAKDASGNNNDGTIWGTMETVTGVQDEALFFSGGYVDLPDMSFTKIKSFSVSLWICPLRATENSRAWVFSSSINTSFSLLSPTDNRGGYSAMMKLNGNTTKYNSSNRFAQNVWKHVVVTYDGENGNMISLYEDGVKKESAKASFKLSSLGNAKENRLGRAERVAIHDFYGYMDDFKVYTRALTDEEVSSMANRGFADMMKTAAESFSLADFNGMSKLDSVMQTLKVPAKSEFASLKLNSFEWTSSHPDVLAADGTFGNPAKATPVELSLKMSRGNVTYTHTVPVTVKPAGTITPDSLQIPTCIGNCPTLPEVISANNGSASLDVTWEMPASDQYATLCATPGSFQVNGKASNGKAVSATIVVSDELFENPLILPSSPDPYITYHDGYYYYVKVSSGKLCVAKSRRLQDIGSAPRIEVWSDSFNYSEYWAPELSFVDGCWYIYFAPLSKALNSRRMFVLRSTDPTNAQAPYEMVGQMGPTTYNEETGKWELNPQEDIYALDGTVLDLGDRKYFIYSAHKAKGVTTQQIFINEMADATTLMGSRVKLPAGGTRWEQMCDIGDPICEGPQILRHNGKVFVLYSTDMSNFQWYQVCALYADEDSDLLDPKSWTKIEGPLLNKSLNPDDDSLAPGHACVVQSPDGKEDWLIYHAFDGDPNSFSGEQEARCARALKIEWDENGMPVMGNPIAFDVLQDEPSGSDDQTIALRYEAEYAVKGQGTQTVKDTRAANKQSVILSASKQSNISFTIEVPEDGNYLISVVGSGVYKRGASLFIDVDGTEYKLKQNMVRLYSNQASKSIGDMRAIPSSLYASPNGEGLYLDLTAGTHTFVITAGDADTCVDYIYLLCEK